MSSFSSFSQTVGWLLLWCIFAETGRKMGWRMLKSWFKILVHKFYMRFGYRRIHIWLKKSANKVALSKCSTIKVCTTHWRFDKTGRCGFEPRIFAVVSLSSSSFLGLMHSRDEAKTDKPSSDMGLLLCLNFTFFCLKLTIIRSHTPKQKENKNLNQG